MAYRIRDIIIASLALIILSPVFLLICIGLWLTQERIFFVQQRPGLDEKPFSLIKFSTMNDVEPGKDEFDMQLDRLTFIGKYLRSWSLDELPQLINVIKGEMSLVGPRPLLMEYVPLYTDSEHRRHDVLPGITGWAQINGRNALSFKQKFAHDLWYVENKSVWLDFKIMFLTFWKVLIREDIHANDFTTCARYDGTN